jgi:hypothetical protein
VTGASSPRGPRALRELTAAARVPHPAQYLGIDKKIAAQGIGYRPNNGSGASLQRPTDTGAGGASHFEFAGRVPHLPDAAARAFASCASLSWASAAPKWSVVVRDDGTAEPRLTAGSFPTTTLFEIVIDFDYTAARARVIAPLR